MGPRTGTGEARWRGRLAPAHLVMLVAGLLGGLLTLAVLRAADETVPVVVAARDLPAGTVVDRTALATAAVGADDAVLARLVAGGEIDELIGRVVVGPLAAGDLISADDLARADARPRPRAMSFPVPRSRAAAGALAPGDVVDVVAADRAGTARFVLDGAEVLAVDDGGDGRLVAGGDDLTLTLAVDEREALELAAALESATVTVVRATGSEPRSEADGA